MGKIPIQNLYYLLCYAWDHRLHAEEERLLDGSRCPDLNNFFAQILKHGIDRLISRGLDRSYLHFEEQTSRIRGSIDFPTSLKSQSTLKGQLHCCFDELSADVPHNRIIKACVTLLARDKAVDFTTRTALSKRLRHFAEVKNTAVHPSGFVRLQLHRNNRHYRFLLHLCELILSSLLPEQQNDGRRRFRDFEQDETHMAWVFERFVLNFAKAHLPGAKCSAKMLNWQADELSEDCLRLLPSMKTDVTISWPNRKLILDCKYYAQALAKGQHDNRHFETKHLYQLHAYITNSSWNPGWEAVEGMLLYPSNGYSLSHHFRLFGKHRIHLYTLDLNQRWPEIHRDLTGILS